MHRGTVGTRCRGTRGTACVTPQGGGVKVKIDLGEERNSSALEFVMVVQVQSSIMQRMVLKMPPNMIRRGTAGQQSNHPATLCWLFWESIFETNVNKWEVITTWRNSITTRGECTKYNVTHTWDERVGECRRHHLLPDAIGYNIVGFYLMSLIYLFIYFFQMRKPLLWI